MFILEASIVAMLLLLQTYILSFNYLPFLSRKNRSFILHKFLEQCSVPYETTDFRMKSTVHKCNSQISNLSNLLSVFGDIIFSWNYVDQAITEQIHLQSAGLAIWATKHDDPS